MAGTLSPGTSPRYLMLAAIVRSLRSQGYQIYKRPFELNIVGIRSPSTTANRFDDSIHLFFKNTVHQWIHFIFQATTDPGTYWLQNPLQPQGTAILKSGQYLGAYAIGLHRGKYNALVQKSPVSIIRDYDRNAILDFDNGFIQTGMYGINIHHAAVSGTNSAVDRFSAGCQVFANAQDFKLFMQLCEVHRKLYGNQFTYTLIDQRAVAREQRKWIALGLSAVGTCAVLITYKFFDP